MPQIVNADLLNAAKRASWAPIALLILHGIFAALFGHEPYVDIAAHFLGGAVAAYFVRRCAVSAPAVFGMLSPLTTDLMAIAMATLAAVAWEEAEFLWDLLFGTHIQLWASNTLRDLALGLAGAVALVLVRRMGVART